MSDEEDYAISADEEYAMSADEEEAVAAAEEETVTEEEDDDYDKPIPYETRKSYRQCLRDFHAGKVDWSPKDILRLVWMIRMLMALVIGFFIGICRIPTIIGQIGFVWLCSRIPTRLISMQTGVDAYATVNDPVKFMKSGTITVYMTFILTAIGGRIVSSRLFPSLCTGAPSETEL